MSKSYSSILIQLNNEHAFVKNDNQNTFRIITVPKGEQRPLHAGKLSIQTNCFMIGTYV